MKEIGILFTPENIRLIRDNRKVQTRRVINPQPQPPGILTTGDGNWRVLLKNGMTKVFDWQRDCPHGQVGDKLYIKEGVIVYEDALEVTQLSGYYMDGCRATKPDEKRLTAMFMPKRFARTWLEITEVRVERVQDISEEDAKAEGVEQRSRTTWRNYFEDCSLHSAQQSYSSLWQAINGKNKPGKEWDAWDLNPFVWAITFRKI
jgi:hypothetical protein